MDLLSGSAARSSGRHQRLSVRFNQSFDRGEVSSEEAALSPAVALGAGADAALLPPTGDVAEAPPPAAVTIPFPTLPLSAASPPLPLRPPLSHCIIGEAATVVPRSFACLRFMAANSRCMQVGGGVQGEASGAGYLIGSGGLSCRGEGGGSAHP